MSDKNEIQIIVAGAPMCGKSAIAHAITHFFEQQHGMLVNLIDDNSVGIIDERPERMLATSKLRFESVKLKGTRVRIQTRSTKAVVRTEGHYRSKTPNTLSLPPQYFKKP